MVDRIIQLHHYDEPLDMVIDGVFVHITNEDIDHHAVIKISLQVTPEIRITIKEMMKFFGCNNQRDFLATITPYALQSFQHTYNPNLKILKGSRTEGFFNGNFKQVVEKYGRCHQYFERVPGGRKEWNVYGDRERTIAPIGEYADYFNLSTSDMVQIMYCHIIVRWKELPSDALAYFEKVNTDFSKYATAFTSV